MKILNHKQRSPEWYACRLGLPTASNFDKIITTKGEQSTSRQKFLYKLAAEKISGIAEENFVSSAMQYGIDTEGEAIKYYELITCETIEQVGLCLSDCGRYGASPDGLINEEGILEIKCPKSETHVEYLFAEKLPTAYFQQVQGQLLVTGRKWCDFLSYSKNMKPFLIRVERNEKFLTLMEKELIKFDEELQEIIKKIGG